MLSQNLLEFDGDSALSLDGRDVRLLVQEKSGSAVFTVRRRFTSRPVCPPDIIVSGISGSVRQAMADAAHAAARLAPSGNPGRRAAAGTRHRKAAEFDPDHLPLTGADPALCRTAKSSARSSVGEVFA